MTAPAPGGACPCGLPATYDDCCGRFHRGDAHAPTAELLMRSRYCAFAVGDMAYLAQTWHPDTRPSKIRDSDDRTWTGLDVQATTGGGLLDHEGTVAFTASHHDDEGDHSFHELSAFTRVNSRWAYVTRLN